METIQNPLAARMAGRYKERLDAMGATCKICGKPFQRTRRTQKCCSRECSDENAKQIVRVRNEARKSARNRPNTILCARCGKEIPNDIANRKYCEACKIEANREHARDYYNRMSKLKKLLKPKTEALPASNLTEEDYIQIIPNTPVRARLKVDPSSLPKPLLPPTRKKHAKSREDAFYQKLAEEKKRQRQYDKKKPRNCHPRDGYTPEEDSLILDMDNAGAPIEEITEILNRSKDGVKYRLKRLRREQDDLRKLLESPPVL